MSLKSEPEDSPVVEADEAGAVVAGIGMIELKRPF